MHHHDDVSTLGTCIYHVKIVFSHQKELLVSI
jgi:hypothetical protein